SLWIMCLPRERITTSISSRSSQRRSRLKNQLLERARTIDSVVDLLQRTIIFAGIFCSLIALGHLALGGKALFGLFDPARGALDTSRAHWPFVDPNHLAVLIEMALMTAFARLLRLTQLTGLRSRTSGDNRRFTARFFQNPEKLGHHTSALLGVFVMLLAGILTLSRMGGTLIVLGMVLMWAMFKRNQFEVGPRPVARRRRRGEEPAFIRVFRRVAKPLFTAAVVLFVLFFVGQTGGERLLNRIEYGLTPNANQTRLEFNYVSLDILSEYPLMGVGLGNWHLAAAEHVSRNLAGYRLDYAHNEYLQFASELGLAGVVFMLLLLATFFTMTRRALNNTSVASDKVLLWGSSAAVGLPLLHAAVEFPLHMPAIVLIFAVAAAVHARLVDQALEG
ncbi:MAG: O-antigen ligase family protein, partial [Bdellovibrionales bacterium]|nr:O-antigen ligase family protein [Bdellovibrionales bacterium]